MPPRQGYSPLQGLARGIESGFRFGSLLKQRKEDREERKTRRAEDISHRDRKFEADEAERAKSADFRSGQAAREERRDLATEKFRAGQAKRAEIKSDPLAPLNASIDRLRKKIFDPNTSQEEKAGFQRREKEYQEMKAAMIAKKRGKREKTNYGAGVNAALGAMGVADPSAATPEQVKTAIEQVGASRVKVSSSQGLGAQNRKALQSYNEQHGRVSNVVGKIDSAIKTIRENPAVLGTTGAVSAAIVGIIDQVKSFASMINPNFGYDKTVTGLVDGLADYGRGKISDEAFDKSTGSFSAGLRKAGIENRVFMGQIMSIAIAAASIEAIDGRGRLTSDMVKRKITEMGGGGQSPEAFIRSALRIRNDLVSRLKARKAALSGALPDISPPETFEAEPPQEEDDSFSGFEILSREPAPRQ